MRNTRCGVITAAGVSWAFPATMICNVANIMGVGEVIGSSCLLGARRARQQTSWLSELAPHFYEEKAVRGSEVPAQKKRRT